MWIYWCIVTASHTTVLGHLGFLLIKTCSNMFLIQANIIDLCVLYESHLPVDSVDYQHVFLRELNTFRDWFEDDCPRLSVFVQTFGLMMIKIFYSLIITCLHFILILFLYLVVNRNWCILNICFSLLLEYLTKSSSRYSSDPWNSFANSFLPFNNP